MPSKNIKSFGDLGGDESDDDSGDQIMHGSFSLLLFLS